jgi:hypothetical protein
MDALHEKALSFPSSLTPIEARIVAKGAHCPNDFEVRAAFHAPWRRTPELEPLYHRAVNKLSAGRLNKIKKNAFLSYMQHVTDAQQSLTSWVDGLAQLFSSGKWEKWGFVLFCGVEHDSQYRAEIEQRALERIDAMGAKAIRDRWSIEWVVVDETSEGATTAGLMLHHHFSQLKPSLAKGLSTDYFLSTYSAPSSLTYLLALWGCARQEQAPAILGAASIVSMYSDIINHRNPFSGLEFLNS